MSACPELREYILRLSIGNVLSGVSHACSKTICIHLRFEWECLCVRVCITVYVCVPVYSVQVLLGNTADVLICFANWSFRLLFAYFACSISRGVHSMGE